MLSSSGSGLCFSRAQWPLKPIFGDKKILLFSYKSYAVIPVIIIVKTLADFWPPSLSMLTFRRYMLKTWGEERGASRVPIQHSRVSCFFLSFYFFQNCFKELWQWLWAPQNSFRALDPLQFFLEHNLAVSLSLYQLMPNNDEVGSLKLKSFDIFCFRSEFSYSETCLAS